jgi:AcrR family transcriptional regulator
MRSTLVNVAETNNTRERLLKATAAAIDKGGEGAVRIRDLTKSCNITAPSIYHFFGSREGLIDAAQAYRFSRGQLQLGNAFSTAIHQSKNKAQFVKLAHQFLTTMFSYERRAIRNVRLNVLGNAVNRPDLSKELSHVQEESNKVVGEALGYAQSKGWVRDDFNGDMFAAWLNGMVNSRRLIEMNGIHPLADEWDVIAKRSICMTLGIPEPARKKTKPTKKRK